MAAQREGGIRQRCRSGRKSRSFIQGRRQPETSVSGGTAADGCPAEAEAIPVTWKCQLS